MPARRTIPRLAAALIASALASCSYATNEPMYDNAGGGGAALRVVSSSPGNNEKDVKLGVAVVLVMSDFPDPATAAYPAVTLRSGANNRDILVSTDLVQKAIVVQPTAQLAPSTEYEVVLSTSVTSLAKGKVAETTSIVFTTGQTAGGGLPALPMLGYTKDIEPILGSCALPGCHNSAGSGGLNLSTGQGFGKLVGVASSEAPSLPRVKATDPAQSYLLRKLLGTPDIVGQRMPPGGMLDDAGIRAVSDWIAGGAMP